MNEDQLNFIKDFLNSEGWKIFVNRNKEQIEEYRRLATQSEVSLEKRLWYSALAHGREEAINEFKNML